MSAVKLLIVAGFLVIGFGLLYCYDPAGTHYFPPCVFHTLTGLYCPGCGSTRAIHQLLHGGFLQAFLLNPLMVISLPILAILLFKPKWSYRPSVAWCALVLLVSYGVLRNINLWPFFFLAPR